MLQNGLISVDIWVLIKPVFSAYTDIFVNSDTYTDMVIADTAICVSVSVSAKNIGQQIYWSISTSHDIL